LLLGTSGFGRDLSDDDINYQAEFVVNSIDYVTWPEGADTDSNGAVSIGVVGNSPIIPRLTELAAEKTKGGGALKVTEVGPEDDLSHFQILYIPTEDKSVLAQILKKVDGKPILTISDAHYFANYGVMINFLGDESDGNKKFEVNRMVLDMTGLKMSSKLLKLAKII
jgi:hypothetical protein